MLRPLPPRHSDSDLARSLRPSWVEIDLAAVRDNVRAIREKIGPGVTLYAVCKADGYGCGAAEAAGAALDAGADAIAVGNPRDALAIRQAGILAPMLLYACSTPDAAEAVLGLNLTVTIHDFPSLRAFSDLNQDVSAFVKVDTGFGRLGFQKREWPQAFADLAESRNVTLAGIYTHFFDPEDRSASEAQFEIFEDACRSAEAAGFSGFQRMVASSRVLAAYPNFELSAVNPGRAVFGFLEGMWKAQLAVSPAVAAIKSRVIQVAEFASGPGKYAAQPGATRPLRAAVIPIGHADGLPQQVDHASALISGRRARLLGTHLEHTVIDVSDIETVEVGDEVVLMGKQGSEAIEAEELADCYGLPLMELVIRLASSLPRLYRS
jgi:alanine racemase